MNPALEYRKRAVESASPVGLVALLYGGAITFLSRAVAAMDANNVERRAAELNRVLDIVAELQGTLNFEKGGTVARQLEKFYVMIRRQILEASIKQSKPMLEQTITMMSSMKQAWEQVERETQMKGLTGLGISAPRTILSNQTAFAGVR
jgi:flagellar protein FliS